MYNSLFVDEYIRSMLKDNNLFVDDCIMRMNSCYRYGMSSPIKKRFKLCLQRRIGQSQPSVWLSVLFMPGNERRRGLRWMIFLPFVFSSTLHLYLNKLLLFLPQKSNENQQGNVALFIASGKQFYVSYLTYLDCQRPHISGLHTHPHPFC